MAFSAPLGTDAGPLAEPPAQSGVRLPEVGLRSTLLETGIEEVELTPTPPICGVVARPFPELSESGHDQARALARALGISTTAAAVLHSRGHVDPDAARRFLEPKLAELTRPDHMADRGVACERLARAVREREHICVFGDYDCDGITSAAIMTGVLRTLGARVTPLLASRFDGGYGVSDRALARILATGARVLVTCDCGSSDHRSLAAATASGMDVIVIDHHLVPAEPLRALAFLNPHRPECGFPYKGLASCGLALSIAAGLRAALGAKIDLRDWLDLVAIGTIADVAPLDGDNRSLVRAGLKTLSEAARPGVRALLERLELQPGTPITGHDVAFRLAPRINAPGRLGAPDLALELLLAPNLDEARLLAARVEAISDERRAISARILEEAQEEIERERYYERSAIVVGREGWNFGMVGIVAGRLVDRYAKPVVVIGFEGARGRGSVRGPAGSRLHDWLAAASRELVRFGGHQAAAGLELEVHRLGQFREQFETACAASESSAKVQGSAERPAVLLDPSDDPSQVVTDFARFEPCGERNPAPRVGVSARLTTAKEVRGGHLKLELQLEGGVRMSAFGVGMGALATNLSGRVTVVGELRPDRWRGGDAVELRAEVIV